MEVNFIVNASLGDNSDARLFGLRLFHCCEPIAVVYEAGAAFRHQGKRSTIQFAVFG